MTLIFILLNIHSQLGPRYAKLNEMIFTKINIILCPELLRSAWSQFHMSSIVKFLKPCSRYIIHVYLEHNTHTHNYTQEHEV